MDAGGIAFGTLGSPSLPGPGMFDSRRVDHLDVAERMHIPGVVSWSNARVAACGVAIATAAAVLAGCGDLFGPSKLTVAVANKTNNTFQNSHVYFKESSFRSGMILPGDRRDFTEYLGVASGETTVEWVLATGTKRTMKVMLDRTYDRKTRGTLLFEVYPDSVTTSFTPAGR